MSLVGDTIRFYIMAVPTFVDLQGFIVGKRFIVKEVAILRRGTVLSHYIFESPFPWRVLTKSEKLTASWLTMHHHRLHWEDGNVAYHRAKDLITSAICGTVHDDDDDDDTSSLVYVKGLEKRNWLADIFDIDVRHELIIKSLDADYDNIVSLNKLNVLNCLRCKTHTKHCALQNVFKIYTWWSEQQ